MSILLLINQAASVVILTYIIIMANHGGSDFINRILYSMVSTALMFNIAGPIVGYNYPPLSEVALNAGAALLMLRGAGKYRMQFAAIKEIMRGIGNDGWRM